MEPPDDLFQPKHVDEQIEYLAQSGLEGTPKHNQSASLVQSLQNYYLKKKQKDLLEHAWEHIAQRYEDSMLISSGEERVLLDEQRKLERLPIMGQMIEIKTVDAHSPQETQHGGFNAMKNKPSSHYGLVTFGRGVKKTGALVRVFSGSIGFARPSTSPSVAPMTSFSGGGTSVSSTPWSPDGSLMASSIGNAVVVWKPSSGEIVSTFHTYGIVMSASWSPDGKYIASTTLDTIQVWNVYTGQVVFTHRVSASSGGYPYAYAMFAHHSMALAFINDSHTIEVWNVATHTKIASYATSTVQLGQFAWSPNDSEIASVNGRDVDIWKANTGALIYRFTKQGDSVNALAWSPDGKYISSGSGYGGSGYVRVWIA